MLDLEHQRAELGYWVGVPYWGNGYATEAAAAMLQYGFTALKLHRILASMYDAQLSVWKNPAEARHAP